MTPAQKIRDWMVLQRILAKRRAKIYIARPAPQSGTADSEEVHLSDKNKGHFDRMAAVFQRLEELHRSVPRSFAQKYFVDRSSDSRMINRMTARIRAKADAHARKEVKQQIIGHDSTATPPEIDAVTGRALAKLQSLRANFYPGGLLELEEIVGPLKKSASGLRLRLLEAGREIEKQKKKQEAEAREKEKKAAAKKPEPRKTVRNQNQNSLPVA